MKAQTGNGRGKREIVGFSQPRREVQILKLQALTWSSRTLAIGEKRLGLGVRCRVWFHDPR
jgi:hypothetical protein